MQPERPTSTWLVVLWFCISGLVVIGLGLILVFVPLLPLSFAGLSTVLAISGILIGAVYLTLGWGLHHRLRGARIGATLLTIARLTLLLFGALGLIAGAGSDSIPLGIGVGAIIAAVIDGIAVVCLLRPEATTVSPLQMVDDRVVFLHPSPLVTSANRVSVSVDRRGVAETNHVVSSLQPLAAWLLLHAGARPLKQYDLNPRNVIGCDSAQCDILLDDPTISQRHAEVRCENGQFVIYDLASTNGTFVNNWRVQRANLLDGDNVRLGNLTLVFKHVLFGETRR